MNVYYDDYQLTSFTDEVVECLANGERFWVATKTSCFYVEGGGMAKDEGTLGGLPVYDVKRGNDLYYHLVDEPLKGKVEGIVDYPNRLRRCQIHDAQHLISAYLFDEYDLMTVSHHVSESDNEIVFAGPVNEIDLPETQKALDKYLLEDLPITISYPSRELLDAHPSFKKLAYDKIRVVQIGEIDFNLCGCLHLKSLREISAVFLKGYEETKEGLIVHYLAGGQINDYLRPRLEVLDKATKLLALDHLDIVSGIERLQAENKNLNYLYQSLKQEKLENLALDLAKETAPLIKELIGLEVKEGQFLVSYLLNQGFSGSIALVLRINEDNCHVLVAGADAKTLFKELSDVFCLKGGGNDRLLQGGGTYKDGMIEWIRRRLDN